RDVRFRLPARNQPRTREARDRGASAARRALRRSEAGDLPRQHRAVLRPAPHPAEGQGRRAMNSQDRVALVTGAGAGIGAAIAERLARDGCMVIAADIDEQAAKETAQRLSGKAWALHMDVGDAA